MDAALKGHPYVKSGLDMACWDILGKVTGQPVCTLLGGRYGEDFALYRAISQEASDVDMFMLARSAPLQSIPRRSGTVVGQASSLALRQSRTDRPPTATG